MFHFHTDMPSNKLLNLWIKLINFSVINGFAMLKRNPLNRLKSLGELINFKQCWFLWCFDCAENLPINFCLRFTSGAKVLFTHFKQNNKTKPHWRRHHDSYSITQVARPHKLMAEIELNIFNRIEMLAWQIRTQIYMPYNTIITTQNTFKLSASLCAIIMNWLLAAQTRANLSTEVSFMGGMDGQEAILV